MKKIPLTIILAGLLLTGGLALQLLHVPNVKDGRVGDGQASGELARRLPDSLNGWSVKDEPLGSSEFLSEETSRILNFDDYAYRIYERGGRKLGVYVAYWAPGRMPTNKVASHTPDRCWVENGWKCTESRFNVNVGAGGQNYKSAQWRLFVPPGGGPKQFVLYWHLVGGELYDYGDRVNTRPHPVKWIRDSLAYAMKGSGEQYFIRLTSDLPMDDLLEDPSLNRLWTELGEIGLKASAPMTL